MAIHSSIMAISKSSWTFAADCQLATVLTNTYCNAAHPRARKNLMDFSRPNRRPPLIPWSTWPLLPPWPHDPHGHSRSSMAGLQSSQEKPQAATDRQRSRTAKAHICDWFVSNCLGIYIYISYDNMYVFGCESDQSKVYLELTAYPTAYSTASSAACNKYFLGGLISMLLLMNMYGKRLWEVLN